jgi:hypothetical protein
LSFTPIEIVGVVTDEVGSPRNGGGPGSALYTVPIRLSRSLSSEEARFLEATWDRPPRFTTMHRPGIARVSGDRIVLDGATVDEVARYHAATLAAVVERFNLEAAQAYERDEQAALARSQAEAAHQQHVKDVALNIRFEVTIQVVRLLRVASRGHC